MVKCKKINCTVENCAFQDLDHSLCQLEEIDVGCVADEIAYDASETSCKSFLARDNEEFATEYYFDE